MAIRVARGLVLWLRQARSYGLERPARAFGNSSAAEFTVLIPVEE
jgi:hypothetical protein